MSEASKRFANGLAHASIPGALTSPTKALAEFDKKVEQSIVHRFEQQAAKYPNRIAVKTTRETLTYDDLNKAANRVARAIIAQRGVEPEPSLF
jgi:non-ribosomal peptide synthetase component F